MGVCVCPTSDIGNGRSYRHVPCTIFKSLAWRVAQTAFRDYTTRRSREKAFGIFSPVTPDILNGRSYRHAAYANSKSLAWRIVQTAFQAYTTRSSGEKAFGSLSAITRTIPCTHRYTLGYPGQDKSCQLQGSLWNILEGYALKDTPST